jgi:hypothetical protein
MDSKDLKNAAASALVGGVLLAANVVSAAGNAAASDPSKFYDANGNEVRRTPCEIYTRVMGYHRPVTFFNNGKKSEFYSRTYFDECKSANSRFMDEYGDAPAADTDGTSTGA